MYSTLTNFQEMIYLKVVGITKLKPYIPDVQ